MNCHKAYVASPYKSFTEQEFAYLGGTQNKSGENDTKNVPSQSPHLDSREGVVVKTLFLDFDGVLHDKFIADQPNLVKFETIMAEPNCFLFVDHLARLLDGYEVDIVVHSGWRLGNQFTQGELREFLRELGSRFKGTTVGLKRFESILQYVDENSIVDYRILDDAPHEFPLRLLELIACNPQLGVSEASVQSQIGAWLRQPTKCKEQ